MTAFVNDGYTQDAKIEFADGEVLITFRPPLGDELQRMLQGKIDQNKFLESKLVSWSGLGLEDHPPTAENIKRLHSRLWGAILDTICGYNVESDLKNS